MLAHLVMLTEKANQFHQSAIRSRTQRRCTHARHSCWQLPSIFHPFLAVRRASAAALRRCAACVACITLVISPFSTAALYASSVPFFSQSTSSLLLSLALRRGAARVALARIRDRARASPPFPRLHRLVRPSLLALTLLILFSPSPPISANLRNLPSPHDVGCNWRTLNALLAWLMFRLLELF